jgi:hypothetical protein
VHFVETARRIKKPRAVQFLEEPLWVGNSAVSWGDPWYSAYPVGARNHVGKRQLKGLGILDPLLNRRSGLSVRNGVLLYKQLIRPIMDYTCPCPIWRSAARSHVRKLQELQSKCLRIATDAPWYVSNRQIHEDFGIPFFAVHIRSLSASFVSNLADAGNPLFGNLEGTCGDQGLIEVTHG